jgi:two-component system, chemotaxis family, CheB/CheR fusion protein
MKPAEPGRSRRNTKASSFGSQVVTSIRAQTRGGDDVTIVGVGASAGGLEAFSSMVRALPPKPGFALVLVQHLAPQHESALPTLLTSYTTMPVLQVTDGMRVEPNHLYVTPPNVQMGLTDGYFDLKPRPEDRTQYTPIDSFLTSLAEHAQSRAIGVVLSGTASDGATGVREIKAVGGITFAQKPETAKYDGMPRAAIATGMVDMVLAPAEIAIELSQVTAHPYVHDFIPTSGEELRVRDDQLRRIFDLLRPASGIDFKQYKLPTIKRRLLRRMALQRLTDVQHYIQLLEDTPGEVRSLYQDLLIHVTRFFREPESFKALAHQVFPKLVEDRGEEQPIRAWVSGCATGEEAYSLAISLLEYLHGHNQDVRIQIFATDVSDTAIEHARAGLYPGSIEADVPPDILRRFFTKVDGSYRVSNTVRDLCVFARQDLTKDPPFSRLDLILCRNVLIYMDMMLQQRLISVFHYALNPQGFLVLGQAETVGSQVGLFTLTDKKFRIYRKKTSPRAPTSLSVDYSAPGVQKRRQAQDVPQPEKALQTEVARIIFDRYAPPGVVVDADLQIVQFRGQTGAYLEPAPGEASLNLLKMSREGLLYGLRTALHAVRKSKAPVRRTGLRVKSSRGWKPVTLDVLPLTSSGRPHYLVLFQEPHKGRNDGDDAEPGTPSTPSRHARRRERQSEFELLKRELAASREYLQAIIQELEAANEELQSANEEILSSNEELQSTNEELDTAKEELQSTNEELNTLNEELHGRNEELSLVNSDLVNLLASVQIAIVIISSDLRIRRFTPMAEKVLNLIPGDLDRPIGHIKPNIDFPDLEQLILEAIDTVAPVEREVRDKSGRWFSLRIRPYKSIDNKIDGAVLTLFDVDVTKRSEQRMRLAKDYTDALMRVIDQPLVVLDSDMRVQTASEYFARALGKTAGAIVGQHLSELEGAWSFTELQERIRGSAATSSPFERVPIVVDGEDSSRRTVWVTGRWLPWHESPDTQVLVLAISAQEATPPGSEV